MPDKCCAKNVGPKKKDNKKDKPDQEEVKVSKALEALANASRTFRNE